MGYAVKLLSPEEGDPLDLPLPFHTYASVHFNLLQVRHSKNIWCRSRSLLQDRADLENFLDPADMRLSHVLFYALFLADNPLYVLLLQTIHSMCLGIVSEVNTPGSCKGALLLVETMEGQLELIQDKDEMDLGE